LFTLLAGTTNNHKLAEIAKLMNDLPVKLKCLNDYSEFPEVIEDGSTFEANAQKKAKAYHDYFKIPVFADDSGLVVPSLNGEPGVRSARYAGENADYAANNRLLISKIKAFPQEQRLAKFVCTICYIDEHRRHFITGTSEGTILEAYRGKGGFGYDPVFYIPSLGKTFAELSMEEKNAISHRGRALRELKKFLKNDLLNAEFY
jgi:XTP/dITP diphosphohydrolase